MTPLRDAVASALLLLILLCGTSTDARLIATIPYDELQEKSDLVVIATPISSEETQERAVLPGFAAREMIGQETKFRVAAVLKGEKLTKEFVLHHYRADKLPMINGPLFVSFVADKGTYLLFLKREPDGRYAPTAGQLDPALHCVHTLSGAFAPAQ